MMLETYLPLWGFIALMIGTPGPANMLMMAAGAQHNYVKLLPFLAGLMTGKLLLIIAIALGLVTFLSNYPLLLNIIALLSACYMVYLAVQGWTPNKTNADGTVKTYRYRQGVIVQPLNPKAWTMVTLAFAQFAIHYNSVFEKYILVAISFLFGQLVFHSLWCFAGILLKKTISENIYVHRGFILLTIAVIIWAVLYR